MKKLFTLLRNYKNAVVYVKQPITNEPIDERSILVFYPGDEVGFWQWSKGDQFNSELQNVKYYVQL